MPNNKEICTWKDCQNIAKHPQLDKNKKEWANLCNDHHNELERSLETLAPKPLLRAWVLASGGAAKMSKEIINAKQ